MARVFDGIAGSGQSAGRCARRCAVRILVSGSSGLVGRAIVRALRDDGHDVVPLVRSGGDGRAAVLWDPASERFDAAAAEGADAVIHLAGESIAAGRWTAARKKSIRESRVKGTRLLANGLARLSRRPSVLISASATGYYGSRGDEVLDESSTLGQGFLAEVCRDWEEAAESARSAGIRTVHLRFGVILAKQGGALAKMLPPFRLGLGGKLGDGQQWMSWVTLDDVVEIVRFVLRGDAVGAWNVVAPAPVRNEAFTRALGRVLSRPTVLPVPAFAARLAFGEMADEALLASSRAVPKRLLDAGFRFRHAELEPALRAILG
jgi:uncharacterized protein